MSSLYQRAAGSVVASVGGRFLVRQVVKGMLGEGGCK